MGKGNEVSCGVMTHGKVTVLGGQAYGLLEVQLPQLCVLCAHALQHKVAIIADVHGGGESNLTASIAKLANGQEWLGGEGRDNVSDAGSKGESRDVEFSIMHGLNDRAVWILDADGMGGRGWVVYQHVHGEEMHCATSVSNGQGVGDGRRTCSM